MMPVRITLTITEGVLKGEEYFFHDSAQWVLGRSPDCDIALPMDLLHRDISRHHCAFEINPPTVRVHDLNSGAPIPCHKTHRIANEGPVNSGTAMWSVLVTPRFA